MIPLFRWVVWAVSLLLVSSPPTTTAPNTPTPEKKSELTAKEIQNRMIEVYAHCKSYRDSGSVTVILKFKDGDTPPTKTSSFRTAFVRPHRFRLDYDNHITPGRLIICRREKNIRTWSSVENKTQVYESLDRAIEATTPYVGDAATIPTLLMPKEFRGWSIADSAPADRLPDRKLGNVDCFVIRGEYLDVPALYWIDKETFLLRRFDYGVFFKEYSSQETVTYDPIVNEEIPDDMLKFNPPEEKTKKVP
jgi:outer membrane lipoprotein-sorting protein